MQTKIIYHWKGYHFWIMTKIKSKQLNHRFESKEPEIDRMSLESNGKVGKYGLAECNLHMPFLKMCTMSE
jgi:hypothetical protein